MEWDEGVGAGGWSGMRGWCWWVEWGEGVGAGGWGEGLVLVGGVRGASFVHYRIYFS